MIKYKKGDWVRALPVALVYPELSSTDEDVTFLTKVQNIVFEVSSSLYGPVSDEFVSHDIEYQVHARPVGIYTCLLEAKSSIMGDQIRNGGYVEFRHEELECVNYLKDNEDEQESH